MSRPKGDLGALVVPKGAAAAAAPFQEAVPAPTPAAPQASAPPAPPTGWPQPQTALTVKLERPLYFKLKTYCLRMEEVGGRRVTHQDVVARAVAEFLAREEGA